MKFLSTKIHGVLDYLVAIMLLSLPWLLNFDDGGASQWVPVLLGVATILYSLLTSYEWGVTSVISMKTHLVIDFMSGVFLAASPWIFGFSDQVFLPHLLAGIFEIIASLVTKTVPATHKGSKDMFYAGTNT